LIGFSEGDGSFVKASRGDLYFVITQDSRDKQVLEYIQKELNIAFSPAPFKNKRAGRLTNHFSKFSTKRSHCTKIFLSGPTKRCYSTSALFDKYYDLNSKCFGKYKQPSPEFLN
jgi:hypothetical protein